MRKETLAATWTGKAIFYDAFALREHTPRHMQTHSYGSATPISPKQLSLIDAENALCVNMSYSDCKTTRGAVRSLVAIINQAAGETIVEADYD